MIFHLTTPPKTLSCAIESTERQDVCKTMLKHIMEQVNIFSLGESYYLPLSVDAQGEEIKCRDLKTMEVVFMIAENLLEAEDCVLYEKCMHISKGFQKTFKYLVIRRIEVLEGVDKNEESDHEQHYYIYSDRPLQNTTHTGEQAKEFAEFIGLEYEGENDQFLVFNEAVFDIDIVNI